jgi:hypothetical protein
MVLLELVIAHPQKETVRATHALLCQWSSALALSADVQYRKSYLSKNCQN